MEEVFQNLIPPVPKRDNSQIPSGKNISFNDKETRKKFFWYIKQAHAQQIPDDVILKRFIEMGWPLDFITESLKRLSVIKENIMIDINNVNKTYETEGNEQIVLRGVDLQVHEGDFVSVTGRSGAGKTTLLNLIGLLDEPTSGTIFVKGNDIFSFSEKQKVEFRLKTISYIFQFFNLINNYNVIDNIGFQLRLQGYNKKKATAKAKEIIDFLDMGDKGNVFPAKLSGGQQQRVAIGRALAKDSQIILADEPTAHLDFKNGEAVIELLQEINVKFGKTIMLVTHEEDYAKEAGTMVYMADGKVSNILS